MYKGKKILAVVPARGGSKGIKLKNLRHLQGKSLIAHVGEVIAQLSIIDHAVISTDHDEIAAEAKKAKIAVPFRRPQAISGDRIADWDVLKHALTATELFDQNHYDVVVMLQPTSPLRRPQDVERTIIKLIDEQLDAVWTVSETDSKSHPLKQLTLSNSGQLEYYDAKGAQIIARQQLQPVYHRNGVAYAMTRDCLIAKKSIKGNNTGAVIIDGIHVSIDTEWDLKLVELILDEQSLTPVDSIL